MANRRDKLSQSPLQKPASKPTQTELMDALVKGSAIEFTSTGARIPETLTQQEWVNAFDKIKAVDNVRQWAIADLMVFGERKWKVTYAEAAKLTGYSNGTLRTYATVARNLTIRIDKLSFAHHQIVAAMSADEQTYWLMQAAVNEWSKRQLIKAMDEQGAMVIIPPTILDRFHKQWHGFSKSQRRLAKDAQPHERRQMAAALRSLAEELERHD